MQTFLPYHRFSDSALALDCLRLGKQRVETMQILNTLTGRSQGWRNHPAVLMWRGYEAQLFGYGLAICREWRRWRYDDTVLEKLLLMADAAGIEPDEFKPPRWITKELRISHQSNLIRKQPDWYRPIFGPNVPDNLEYIWPAQPATQSLCNKVTISHVIGLVIPEPEH